MTKSKKEYVIPFVGLKLGVHEFTFEVTDSFFEEFEYSIISSGDVKVTLRLDKRETMLIGDFEIEGTVRAACDRCTDMAEVEIGGEYQLIFKFGDEPSDDESLVVLYPEDYEIDLTDHILELITVSLPSRLVHDEGECNEEMMNLIEQYSFHSSIEEEEDESEDEVDPRWEALKKLK